MKLRTLNDVLAQELRELLGAECCVYEGMKKLCRHVTDPELLQALRQHRDATDMQIQRLKKVLADLGEKAKPIDSSAVEGMFRDARQALKGKNIGAHVADIYVIATAMKILNFEINCYETLLPAVRELGLGEIHVPEQLEESLDVEKAALGTLQRLGQRLLKEEVTFPEATGSQEPTAEDVDFEPGHDQYYDDVHQPHPGDVDDERDEDVPEEGALPDERPAAMPSRHQI